MSNPNLRVWDKVWQTDAAYTKGFSRGGGFKGTATNATWLARQATATFGPCGIGWGFKVLHEDYRQGAGHDVVHVIRLQLWYVLDGVRGEIEQFGQTTFVGSNKNGAFTDEEAPKKSITDAVSKCLSLLGFAADVYLGYWDDSKYVDAAKADAGWSDYQEPTGDEPISAPLAQTALSGEGQRRAAKQNEGKPTPDEAKAIADGWVNAFRAMTHVDEVVAWLPTMIAAWDVSDKRYRGRVYKACFAHAESGLVEGLSNVGLEEAWGHHVSIARGELKGDEQS
mgnify:FL=1